MGSVGDLSCFDEASPCIEEQTSICVIDIAQSSTANDMAAQAVYVPWHLCVDEGNSLAHCHTEVGIASSDVQDCLNNRVNSLIPDYLSKVKGVNSLPHEEVNGKQVDADYGSLKAAFCDADPNLTGCGGPGPTPMPSPSPSPTPTPTPTPTPSPFPTPSPSPSKCHAVSTLVDDEWCQENCPDFCPQDLCECDNILV